MKRLTAIALSILLCGAIVGDSNAQSDLGFKGIGGRLMIVFPSDLDTGFGLGAIGDFGTIVPLLHLQGTLDYWGASQGSGPVEVKVKDFVFGGRVVYNFEVKNPKFKPYAGGGLAIHILKAEVPAQTILNVSVPASSETDVKLGLDLVGGAAYVINPKLDLTGELMYRIVSDFGHFGLNVGIIYWLGKSAPPAEEKPKTDSGPN